MEKVDELTALAYLGYLFSQDLIFLEYAGQVSLSDSVGLRSISHNRFNRYLLKAQIIKMHNVLGKIKVILSVCTSYIPVLVIATLFNKALEILGYQVVAACAVNTHSHTVVDFLSAIDGKHDIVHLTVDEIDHFIGQVHAVSGSCESEYLS